MAAVAYKIWTRDKTKKKIVAGRDLDDLTENVEVKMGISKAFKLQLEDGTDVDDNTALQMVSQGDVLYIVFCEDDLLDDPEPVSDDISNLLQQVGAVKASSMKPAQQMEKRLEVDNYEGTRNTGSKFSIKTDRWPHTFIAALREKRRPSPRDRLLTQKVIVDEFIHSGEKPSRSIFRSISQTVVAMSPSSFENDCGTGAEGFARSLETTYYNHHIIRKAMAQKRKQRDPNNTSDTTRKRQVKDSYGCSQWQPTEIPEGESTESLEEKKEWLHLEYQKRDRDKLRIDEYMEFTYISQRWDINKQPSCLRDVKQNWPFLFEPPHLFHHFKRLVGHETNAVFMNNLASKGESVLSFLTDTNKVSDRWKMLLRAAEDQSPAERVTLRHAASICVLPGYFQEDEDFFVKEFQETATSKDLQTGLQVQSPVLAFAGPNPFLATKFTICIDGAPVISSSSLLQGIQLWFVCFYVFNLEYPQEIAATLEFIQRLLFDIRPDRGSKRQKNSRGGPNSKVISLCTKLKDHEQKWSP